MACLQAVNSELLKDKEEALPLLEAYRSAYNVVFPLRLFCLASCAALCRVHKFNTCINKGVCSVQKIYLLLI